MNGVLILAHGSRRKETENTLQKVAQMVKEKITVPTEIAYMEFSDQNIAYGLDQLVSKGISQIKVVPYFLFSGIHILEDIPKELNDYVQKHPGVSITMGDTLGADPRIADILVDRIMA